MSVKTQRTVVPQLGTANEPVETTHDTALASLDSDDELISHAALRAQVSLSKAAQHAAELTAEGLEAENAVLRRTLAEAEEAATPARARARALQRVSHRQQRLIDLQWLMLDRRGAEVPDAVLGESETRRRGRNQSNLANARSGSVYNSSAGNSTVNEGAQGGEDQDQDNEAAIDTFTLLSRAEGQLAAVADTLPALGAALEASAQGVKYADLMGLKEQIDGLHRAWAPLPAQFYAHAGQRGNARGQYLVDGLGGIEAYWTCDE